MRIFMYILLLLNKTRCIFTGSLNFCIIFAIWLVVKFTNIKILYNNYTLSNCRDILTSGCNHNLSYQINLLVATLISVCIYQMMVIIEFSMFPCIPDKFLNFGLLHFLMKPV